MNSKIACSSVLGAGGPCWPGRIRPLGPDVISAIGAAAIVHVRSAGVWSTLPAMSIARMRSVCWPGSSVNSSGEAQASHARLSTWHSYSSIHGGVASSVPNHSNSAVVSPVKAGGLTVMPVPGAEVSGAIVHSWTIGDGSTLPSNSGLFGSGISGSKMSFARTSNRCGPGASWKSAYV